MDTKREFLHGLVQQLSEADQMPEIAQLLSATFVLVDSSDLAEGQKFLAKSQAIDAAKSAAYRAAAAPRTALSSEEIAAMSVQDAPDSSRVPRHPDDRGGALTAAAMAYYTTPIVQRGQQTSKANLKPEQTEERRLTSEQIAKLTVVRVPKLK